MQPPQKKTPGFSVLLKAMLSVKLEGDRIWPIEWAEPALGWGCGHYPETSSGTRFDFPEGSTAILCFGAHLPTSAAYKRGETRTFIFKVLFEIVGIFAPIRTFNPFPKNLLALSNSAQAKRERIPPDLSVPESEDVELICKRAELLIKSVRTHELSRNRASSRRRKSL